MLIWPVPHDAEVFFTDGNTPYLKGPGVALVGQTAMAPIGKIQGFLDGFADELEFSDYTQDPDPLDGGQGLAKLAGQTCYASFSPNRSWNKDAGAYLNKIIASGHGSVLEHAQVTVFVWGVSRSLTHELVRHRAGCAYSQLSQRYVDGKVLRFVERPEYQTDADLHAMFCRRIDRAAAEYEEVAQRMLKLQSQGEEILSAEHKRDRRKKVNQAARSVLPNETETIVTMTGNVRAWRNVLEVRASAHAETEIRLLAMIIHDMLREAVPLFFEDYEVDPLPDGTTALRTPHPKV